MAKQDLGVLDGLYLIDSDSHYSEPHDLWTSRAPAKLQDLVPLVRPNAKGELRWSAVPDTRASGFSAPSARLDGDEHEPPKRAGVDQRHAAWAPGGEGPGQPGQ